MLVKVLDLGYLCCLVFVIESSIQYRYHAFITIYETQYRAAPILCDMKRLM